MAKKLKTDNECCGSGCCDDKKASPFVGIAGALGAFLVAIVAIIAIFAQEQLGIVVPISFAIALLGIFLGYFAYKKA